MIRKDLLKEFLSANNITTAIELQGALKNIFASTLQEMLEAELDEHLGYTRYDYKNKKTNNSRNGTTPKKLLSDFGEVTVSVPRDRLGEFEPVAVKKGEKDISKIEDKILGMYAKGMSTRDIASHLEEIYGFQASPGLISNITDKIMPIAKEWQNRPLESIYPIIFLDAIHYKVKSDGKVVNKAAYVIMGININGIKDVLGIWIGENESSKYWLNVLNELKNRGVQDVLLACIDGLKGFSDALRVVYPNAEIQRCIIHQIRNSTRYISYRDRKEFCKDLKEVYTAVNEDAALSALADLDAKWGKTYSIAINSWQNNWDELNTFFKYPEEIRRLIYTTNTIESYNRQLRKATKSKSIFPTDDSLLKMLYLVTQDVSKKWIQPVRNWGYILDQLYIYFGDRIDLNQIG